MIIYVGLGTQNCRQVKKLEYLELEYLLIQLFKVVLGGYHRIIFRVKVKTVKLIGGRGY